MMCGVNTEINKTFRNIDSLIYNIMENADDGNSCVVVGYGDFIKELFLHTLSNYVVDISNLDFDNWGYSGLYEFYMDENYVVSIAMLENDNGYLESIADYIYVDDRCPYGYVEFLNYKGVPYDLFFLETEEDCELCEENNEFTCDGKSCETCDFCDEDVAEIDFDICEHDIHSEVPNIYIEQMYGNITFGDYIQNY